MTKERRYVLTWDAREEKERIHGCFECALEGVKAPLFWKSKDEPWIARCENGHETDLWPQKEQGLPLL